jgi:hypothetical protein
MRRKSLRLSALELRGYGGQARRNGQQYAWFGYRTRASSSASGRRRFDLTADFSAGVQSVRDVYIDQAGVQRRQENALRTAIREEGGL